MIHLLLLIASIAGALAFRSRTNWQTPCQDCRWQKSMRAFVVPPLLLLSTAMALALMGNHGPMAQGQYGSLPYGIALAFLTAALGIVLCQGIRSFVTLRQVVGQPTIDLLEQPAYLVEGDRPFIAQIGLWHPKLVLTQALLETLDSEHLNAVLRHEAAHQHFHDTFWFFLLGCLRRLTCWLPQSEALWQELLSLRELRADRWAAQEVDPLLLAEALYQVVSPPMEPELAAGFNYSETNPEDRLETRIQALLSPKPPMRANPWDWRYVVLVLLPFLVIPFHG
jgi:Zn-dependent protease with chaperone function